MHGTAEYHTAARTRVELLGPPRAIQKIRVVERVDHAQGAEAAGSDELAGREHRRVETVARSDNEMHPCPGRRFDHPPGLVHRHRQRLVDQHVQAARDGAADVLAVELVWTGDVDRVDVGLVEHLPGVRVGAAAE
ncbi:MAG: hypothetical protein M5U09_22620, partial [Gammaproteobacteria bacterium]|nr:hypothetical protein [Gammaproteobacteria bacterium]